MVTTYVSTSLNRYEFEMPTEFASERDSERVEQQEEEPPQIINGTRSPFIPCLLCYKHDLAKELNYESIIDTFASARARRVNIRSSS